MSVAGEETVRAAAVEARLVMRGVKKRFGATIALGGVDIEVAKGEVHALIGENGAGKSTLLKILAGAHPADEGDLTLDGRPYRPRSPLDARGVGVAMVYQELSLCPHLTVAENVLLGTEPTRFGFVRASEVEERVERVLAAVIGDRRGHPIEPSTRVMDLPPAAQQLVEIARALAQKNCRLLILDEPTSSLGKGDTDRLFGLISRLRDDGLSIVYVSHFLEEVQAIADSYTVLRDGTSVGRGTMRAPSEPKSARVLQMNAIVHQMAGRKIEQLFPRSQRTPGEVILEVSDLAGALKPQRAAFSLRRGEVLGIAGLVGGGRTELLRAIFALDPVVRGRVTIGGISRPSSSPARRLAEGLGLLSEDRKGEGLATGRSIADNLTLSKLVGLGPAGPVLTSRQAAVSRPLLERLSVKCQGPEQAVGDLSGGNQQKVAIARLLYHGVDVLLLDEPTRGIDVGSKAQIYALIDALALAGKAIVMVSSYLPELLGVCDRIAVMRRGRLGEAHPVEGLTEHALLMEGTGGDDAGARDSSPRPPTAVSEVAR